MLGELDAEQIEELLRAEVLGRIGCHADGRTYVVPVTFAYDGECVYGHSRRWHEGANDARESVGVLRD